METFGLLDLEVEKYVTLLNDLDIKASSSDHDLSQGDAREDAYSKVWKSMVVRERMLRQKSRHQWIRERDSNSRFFISV